MVPVDRAPQAQVVEPVPQEVGSGAGQLALVEGEEACRLLGGQGPQRSSVLFLPMGRLPPLQRSPSLQDVLTPHEEEQRLSVQLDQGYISRSSPQPHDDDDGEGVGGGGGGGGGGRRAAAVPPGPEDFFQELSKNPGLEPEEPPCGALP